MRKSHEIRKELSEKMTALDSCQDRAAALKEIERLTTELNETMVSEAAERAIANQRAFDQAYKPEEIKRFSFAKAIRQAIDGSLDGLEKEMHDIGVQEMKDAGVTAGGVVIPSKLLRTFDVQNATTATEGKEFVQITRMSYVEALRNALVMSMLGAQYLGGLSGHLRLVKGGAATATWEAEGAAGDTQKLTFDTIDMSPKRLMVQAGYTKDLIYQSSLDVNQIIMQELLRAHASGLDAAAIAGAGQSGQPAGILYNAYVNSVAIGASGGPITFAKLIELETAVSIDNALFGGLAYLTNAKVVGKMKQIQQVDGYPAYLLENNMANGYKVAMTNAVPSDLTKSSTTGCSALIFGNFNEVKICQWGGLDLIVDPFTSKAKAIIEINVTAYHDIGITRPESFAAIKDVTTA